MNPAREGGGPGIDGTPVPGGAARIAYGPVPSRRLGYSLGINNIRPKTCTYACVYCQAGRNREMTVAPRAFHDPDRLVAEVRARIDAVRRAGEAIDVLSFVPDGEPSLDIHLGEEIDALRSVDLPLAVVTNASLLGHPGISGALEPVDWISVKVDTVDEKTWRRINRPHRSLCLKDILRGLINFGRKYEGTLVTETMLVGGVNDSARHATATAAFLADLGPAKAYLAVPTRPPLCGWVRAPYEERLVNAYATFDARLADVELLIGYEGDRFTTAGDPAENLLGITAVHPMREDAVRTLLHRMSVEWGVVERLLAEKRLVRVEHAGHDYILRRPQVD